LTDALPLDVLERDPGLATAAMVPVSRMLPALLSVQLTDEGVQHAVHGRDLGPGDIEKGVGTPAPFFVRLIDPAGDLVAIATPVGVSGLLHPTVVLV
jgi:hypothetical protein